MQKLGVFVLMLIISTSFALAASANSTEYQLQVVFPAGGGKTNTSTWNLQTIIGQPIIGKTNTTTYTGLLGFFYGRYYNINTAPNIPTITGPNHNSRVILGSAHLLFSATDGESNPLTYYIYADNSSPPSTEIDSTTNTYYDYSVVDGNSYWWKVRAYDSELYSDYSSIWNFTANTEPTQDNPTITPSNPSSNQTMTCEPQNTADGDSDTLVYEHNWFIDDASLTLLNWACDYNTTTNTREVDDYARTNNGTISGASYSTTGKYGGGYSFDGTDDYIYKSSPNFIDKTNGSIELWFKTNDYTYDGEMAMLSVSTNSSNDDELLIQYVGNASDVMRFELQQNGSVVLQLDSNDSIADNNWHHMVVTSDESTVKMYLDNSSQTLTETTGTNSGQWFDDATDADIFSIGAVKRATPEVEFSGMLDIIRIYNRSLSSNQASRIYSDTGTNMSKIVSDETVITEVWKCSVTAVDGYENSATKNDSETIKNTLPTKVILSLPENNSASYNRSQNFTWQAASDPEGSPLTYNITIANNSGFSSPSWEISGLSALNYIPPALMEINTTYWWRVCAHDNTSSGDWSDTWNVTVNELKSITLLISSVDFGQLQPTNSSDTIDNDPMPIVVKNNGNINVNISVSANESLFVNANLDKENFQMKIEDNETSSFAAANTTSWINISDSGKRMIRNLYFNETSNEAQIELNVTVPYKEIAKEVTIDVTVTGE